MAEKHTPGPWEVTRTSLHWYVVPAGGHMGNAVASGILPAHTFHMTCEEKNATSYMADARLISAAPDLLEALKDCLTRFVEAFPASAEYEPIKRGFAVCAKAEGK